MLRAALIRWWRRSSTGDDPARAEIPESERPAWRERWAGMPHRRLDDPTRCALDSALGRAYGPPRSVTVSLAPPEHAHRLVDRRPGRCPICGAKVRRPDGLAAKLNPTWSNGMSLGIGVWVHAACFEACPDAGEPAPVPW